MGIHSAFFKLLHMDRLLWQSSLTIFSACH